MGDFEFAKGPKAGVDDLVLLPKIEEGQIVDNLKKRYATDLIYTYIGPVLIAVNPYRDVGVSGLDYVKRYKNKFRYENPPHIFALAESAYRSMINDQESQCVIISGESGAGKTESAKLIMKYIAAVSGKTGEVERVKNIILETNPLLEAFGNAKTLRNNNSSRFGKYFEIQFSTSGDPQGGKITNYLLEKSRVVYQTKGERNFHIFYLLCKGSTPEERKEFQINNPQDFHYLNQSGCYDVDGIDDVEWMGEVRNAMDVIGINKTEQHSIFKLLAGILWLGNISFADEGNEKAKVADEAVLNYAAWLLGLEPSALQMALLFRRITTGGIGRRGSTYNVPQNVDQAGQIRDALAKSLFERLFDWLVDRVNKAMETNQNDPLVISVLDIFGFEIFKNNGFEQFCISEGTPILLASGESLPIEKVVAKVKEGEKVRLHAPNADSNSGVTQSVTECTDAWIKGKKPCVTLVMEDGRELTCTADHEIMTQEGKWEAAGDLETGLTRLSASAIEYPVDKTSEDEADWNLTSSNMTFAMDTTENRNKTLAFARILGSVIGSGSVAEKHQTASCTVETKIGLDQLCRDSRSVLCSDPTVYRNKDDKVWTVEFESPLLQDLKADPMDRHTQGISVPSFVNSAPVSFKREFLAALFGSYGCAPELNKMKDGNFTSVMLVHSTEESEIQTMKQHMHSIAELLKDCDVDMSGYSVQVSEYLKAVQLHLPNSLSFGEKIGFRYCVHKQLRMGAAMAYWRMAAKSQEQSKLIANEQDVEEFLKNVGCTEWFEKEYIVNANDTNIPTMSLQVIDRCDSGTKEVYDLSVPGPTSFFAAGIGVHNCINYVNEKLQQIFIELTLKAEQEEYVKEGIKWTPIKYFNNKIVCDLIESKNPPGIFSVLDDTCHTVHAMDASQADQKFVSKCDDNFSSHQHYQGRGAMFNIKHYAGDVTYNSSGFTEKNRDQLYVTLIECMQSSNDQFIRSFFPEDTNSDSRKRPTTAGFKIKNSAQALVEALMRCQPHYIRCIKPNETKKPRDFDDKRVSHQVKYLGLLENVRVRRAGFAYRREYAKFLDQFGILSSQTWPNPWRGDPRAGCEAVLQDLKIDKEEYQFGNTKLFLRSPETLFSLEEQKERRYHEAATTIIRSFRSYRMRKYFLELRQAATDIFVGKKERRRLSINRQFQGDYVNFLDNAQLQEKMSDYIDEDVVFGDVVNKPVRKRFRGHRIDKVNVLVTNQALYFIERMKKKKQYFMELTKRARLPEITGVSLSTLQDNWVIVHIQSQEDLLFECDKKTEMVSILNDNYKQTNNRDLPITFANSLPYQANPKGKKKSVEFKKDENPKYKLANLTGSSSKWSVTINSGLPADTKPKQIQNKASSGGGSGGGNRGSQRRGFQSSMMSSTQQEASYGQSVQKHMPAPAKPAPPPPARNPQVRSLYEYMAQSSDELSIREGDVINLIGKDPSGWWEGELNGKRGLFPGNYVQEL
eukprot:gb/GECH01012383.1/.p1 GENE.gb/GECH01012383.1/~~gb/GECH01012383.1/.p1  ORF type:complete len:1469 (+),score=336.96 gb/GECH01012383.1/:1-4407(+)